jgi:Endonuclease I
MSTLLRQSFLFLGMKLIRTVILIFGLSLCAWHELPAQGFRLLFSGSTGPALLDSLFQHFKPDTVLTYGEARDTLYAKILAIDDDSVRCIYSGHTLYLDPTQDPTQYIYLGGSTLGMNAEHSYPQSKGAETGFARSDMHHLYPTRIPVNEARGSLPYAEIPDNQTQKWYRKAQIFTTKPTSFIEQYSEWTPTAFEPPESSKGDLARSIFYMYTMYRSQMNAADPNFFELQRATLCNWNAQDPADSIELRKTWRIAPYQDGKPNPYVLDCTLAQRTWCPNVTPNCTLNSKEPNVVLYLDLRIVPQPAQQQARVEVFLPFSGDIRITIYAFTGQQMATAWAKDAQAGLFSLPLNIETLAQSGFHSFFLSFELLGDKDAVRRSIPLLLGNH